jgi:DNA polymerase (family 10)
MKNKVKNLAREIRDKLKPFCKRIEIAGSIRRHEKNPGDIDVVLIPKDRVKLEEKMKTLGKFIQGGEKESTWKVQNVNVELYYTNEDEWGAELLAYSGKKGSNIGLRMVAKRKGFKLTQHGLYNRKTGRKVAGKTEEEIYAALGRPYKEPEDR